MRATAQGKYFNILEIPVNNAVVVEVFDAVQSRSLLLIGLNLARACRSRTASPCDSDRILLREPALLQYPFEQLTAHSQLEREVVFRSCLKPLVKFDLKIVPSGSYVVDKGKHARCWGGLVLSTSPSRSKHWTHSP